jgi:hypothetical protein
LGIGSGIVKHLRDFTLGQVGVPDVHRCHRGEPGHGLPVGRHRRACRRAGVGLGEAVVAARDREARRQPLHVILERPRKGLVEIVQVEQQPTFGRGEQAEVGQVRVAAELDLQTSRGRAFQVGRHDLGRTR